MVSLVHQNCQKVEDSKKEERQLLAVIYQKLAGRNK